MKYCKCGCKKKIPSKLSHKYDGIPKYILGHNSKGKNNPSFIDGRSLKINYCIDCHTIINWQSNRCRKCAGKKHSLYMKVHSPTYIDGRSTKKHYCTDCKKKITRQAKRCGSCAIKERFKDSRNHPFYGLKGRKAANYIHGNSYKPYTSDFNNKLKNKIRQRDNYTCQKCNITEEEHFIVYGRDLEVHHIDYNKRNCKEENLISLCKDCNMKVNANRDYWFAYFTYIMKNNG